MSLACKVMSRFHRIVALLTVALTAGLLAADGDSSLIDAVKRGDHNAVRAQLRGKVDVNAPAWTARRRCTGRCRPTIPSS